MAVCHHLPDEFRVGQPTPCGFKGDTLIRPEKVRLPPAPSLEVAHTYLVDWHAVDRVAICDLCRARTDVVAYFQGEDFFRRSIPLAPQQGPERGQRTLAEQDSHQRRRARAEDGVVEEEM